MGRTPEGVGRTAEWRPLRVIKDGEIAANFHFVADAAVPPGFETSCPPRMATRPFCSTLQCKFWNAEMAGSALDGLYFATTTLNGSAGNDGMASGASPLSLKIDWGTAGRVRGSVRGPFEFPTADLLDNAGDD